MLGYTVEKRVRPEWRQLLGGLGSVNIGTRAGAEKESGKARKNGEGRRLDAHGWSFP